MFYILVNAACRPGRRAQIYMCGHRAVPFTLCEGRGFVGIRRQVLGVCDSNPITSFTQARTEKAKSGVVKTREHVVGASLDTHPDGDVCSVRVYGNEQYVGIQYNRVKLCIVDWRSLHAQGRTIGAKPTELCTGPTPGLRQIRLFQILCRSQQHLLFYTASVLLL